MKRKLFSALFLLLTAAMGAWAGTIDLSTLSADYTAQDGDVLTGTLAGDYKISVADGARITLERATITNLTNSSDYSFAGITCEGDATITLVGENAVKGAYADYPGIYVPSGSTLNIWGNGSLTASSNGFGAGIGAGFYMPCGNIVINGGTITATGGENAAGIGGGSRTACGDITINGGIITATGGGMAAAIGGGYNGTSLGNITISDNITSITATAGTNAPYSIGAGTNGADGTVTIASTVTGNLGTSPYYYEGTGAWVQGLTGSGTAADPYLITTDDDWTMFVSNIANGTDYSGKYVKLTADISATQKVGFVGTTSTLRSNPFRGTFDGDGHIITADITDTRDYHTALFAYVNNATIQNLTVAGSIKGYRDCAALVGVCDGVITIQDCTVTATVTSEETGTHMGGILAQAKSSGVTIARCVFSGKLVSSSPKSVFFGWGDGASSGRSRTITDCLFLMQDDQDTSNLDMANQSGGVDGNITITRCYKTTDAGNYGTQVQIALPEGEVYKPLTLVDGNTYYAVAAATGINVSYLYTGSAIEPEPVVTCEGITLTRDTDYSVAYADNTDTGIATIILTAQGRYFGSKAIRFRIEDYTPLTASDTELTDGHFYKLTEDVTITGGRIIISGNVSLTLTDGKTFTASRGIELAAGNQLTIEGGEKNTGKLVVWAQFPEPRKSGIGAKQLGTLIINGGTINVTAGDYGAGIGGDSENTAGGSITINGGIVNAQGGFAAAGIGGGANFVYGNNGQCPTITINGGQVTASSIASGPGIGSGYNYYNHELYNSGSVTLGWTHPDDFISLSGAKTDYGYGISSRIATVGFADGKQFKIESNSCLATTSNIKEVRTIKLVPIVNPLSLADDADNTTTITDAVGTDKDAILMGRTLYKDGNWNTLTLPFDLNDIAGTPLEDATIQTLKSSAFDATTQTLTLTFSEAVTSLTAGTPYIIKWEKEENYEDNDTYNLVCPVFSGVTITRTTTDVTTDAVTFKGIFSPYTIGSEGDNTKLYMGSDNTLYWPNGAMTIGSCRAYFQLDGDIRGGDPKNEIKEIRMNFGDQPTAIHNSQFTIHNEAGAVYDLQGRKVADNCELRIVNCELKPGIYIIGGKKVLIK